MDITRWHRYFHAGLYLSSKVSDKSIVVNVAGDDSPVLWTCSTPVSDAPEASVFPRYVAASLNNIVMTHGACSWEIRGDRDLANEIDAILAREFRQALEVLRIRSSSYTERPANASELRPFTHRPPSHADSSWRLGIDIGNSRIKIAVLSGETVKDLQEEESKIRNISIGPIEYFSRIVEMIRGLESSLPVRHFSSIGIAWFGDVYRGELLTQAADLAPWSTGAWQEELRSVPAHLASHGLFIRFWGDSEALGRYIGARGKFPKTYLLILGTSTGGAYFSRTGRYQEGANLVSRLVIDLSHDAPPHAATKTPGVLQQFSGTYGLRRALAVTSPEGVENREIAEDPYLRLKDLLLSSEPRECAWGQAAIAAIAEWLSIAVGDLRTHYELEALLLSGGITRDLIGDKLAAALELKLKTLETGAFRVGRLSDKTNWPASHEVAIAAALAASHSEAPQENIQG